MTIIEFRGTRMGRKHRKQPSQPRRIADPAERARLEGRGTSPSEWGANDEALALPANEDVVTTMDRSVAITRRTRFDCFELLFRTPRSRLSEASYHAVRRFQADLAILHRTQGASDAIRSTGRGSTGAYAEVTEDFSITRVEAGARVDAVLAGMHHGWCAKMIRDLCETEVIRGQTPNWHPIVRRHTGVVDHRQRGRFVVIACDELAESYARIDNAPRRNAA